MIIPRILVVDDEKEIRESFSDYFQRRLSCQIDMCASGAEAIAALEARAYNVLILDLHMPDVDGISVLKRARDKAPDMIALVVTRLDDPENTRAVEALGGIYVAKPVTLKALQFILERELDKHGGFAYRPAA